MRAGLGLNPPSGVVSPNGKRLRQHGSIGNILHWQLDVVFRADDARTRKNYGPQNLSVIRRMALDMLRAHPASRPIARKMKLATWSKEFCYELFTHRR